MCSLDDGGNLQTASETGFALEENGAQLACFCVAVVSALDAEASLVGCPCMGEGSRRRTDETQQDSELVRAGERVKVCLARNLVSASLF